jgi:murein DD-endopeptidase MepM/ murein hydrolase activator NlpD
MDPFSGEGAFHKGVDLTAPRGTPVHVTADGVVLKAQWDGGYGKLVVVDHGNGIETYYAHLSQFMVIPGQEVRRGQVVALSGGTGHATGPHLHYEVRLSGIPVNPYKYLAKSTLPVRTKPAHSDLGL